MRKHSDSLIESTLNWRFTTLSGIDSVGSPVYVVEDLSDRVLRLEDFKGDGDALDSGEVTLFADGLSAPVGLVSLVEGYNADYDSDGDVDGFDFLEWQRGQSPMPRSALDLNLWETQFGTTFLPTAVAVEVPEPKNCLGLFLGLLFLLSCRNINVSWFAVPVASDPRG